MLGNWKFFQVGEEWALAISVIFLELLTCWKGSLRIFSFYKESNNQKSIKQTHPKSAKDEDKRMAIKKETHSSSMRKSFFSQNK